MTSSPQPLNCGAANCKLDGGVRLTDAGMDFIRCPTCRVLHIVPENLIHMTVLPDPVGKLSAVMKVLMSMRMRWLKREFPQLADRHIRIADIGCGDGQFLEFLRERNYDRAIGIEPDATRARNARVRGVPVFASGEEAEAAGLVKGEVDILFVWHVLEHIDRPVDFLKAYASWLAPSGVIVISVPNQASVQTRLFGYFSAYPDYGRHLWYQTADYLDGFAQNLPELHAALVRDGNYEYEIFSWVDSIASAITRRQNFIHKALKKGDGSLVHRLAAAFMALCLLPVAMILSPVSIRLGRGSTLTFALQARQKIPPNQPILGSAHRRTSEEHA
jgi:SAM-dependent methyltransferase